MTSAFQGTSFVGKGAWSIIKTKIEVFDVKIIFLTQPVLYFIFQVRTDHKMLQGPLKKTIKTIIRFTFVVEKLMYHSLFWLWEIFCQLDHMAFSF